MILTLFSILNDSMILSQDGVGAAGHKTGSVASAAPALGNAHGHWHPAPGAAPVW